ncbi:MAG: transcriptional regulator, partial [Rhodospirillaceae bacterium]|nr:transcriptional regulator [Rhodospirillaceae bacterium]
ENLAIQAAIGGQGVMLVNPIIIEAELAAGTLVMPFDMVLKSNTSVWVVAPERTADRPKVKAFRDWIYSEVAKILPE